MTAMGGWLCVLSGLVISGSSQACVTGEKGRLSCPDRETKAQRGECTLQESHSSANGNLEITSAPRASGVAEAGLLSPLGQL